MAPVNLYVFDFRSKDDNGGIRAFGSFAQRDWFVALTWEFREFVNWDDDPPNCREKWIKLFGAPPPNLGNNPNDYLSNNFSIAKPD